MRKYIFYILVAALLASPAIASDLRVLLENRVGTNATAGQIVQIATDADEGFILAVNGTTGSLAGVLASACVSNSTSNQTCWVVVSGVVDVQLWHNSTYNSTATRGNILFIGENSGEANGTETATAGSNATVGVALESTNGSVYKVKALLKL